MIEMWDHQFCEVHEDINTALKNSDGHTAHMLMHDHLNKTWLEVARILTDGGIACINIGDATRKIGSTFSLYPNHSCIVQYFITHDFSMLPMIIWRKPSNKPNKFMGSGMLPPNVYVTHEHEFILIFRKGGNRKFSTKEKNLRYQSAFFWEERNIWFSDIWTDLKGTGQNLKLDLEKEIRNRSAAFPFELPFRLIHMFSIQGDTIVDPFLGTGTTTLAALAAGRNSIGFECDTGLFSLIQKNIVSCTEFCQKYVQKRLINHDAYIRQRMQEGKTSLHVSEEYGFPVITSQEVKIQIPYADQITEIGDALFQATYLSDQRQLWKADIQTEF